MRSDTPAPDWIGDVVERTQWNTQGVLGGVGFAHLWHVWLFVAAFLGLAALGWWLNHRDDGARGVRGFLAFLFPGGVYRHPSSRADLTLILINQIASPLSLALAVGLAGWLASGTSHLLAGLFGRTPDVQWSLGPVAAFTLCLALVSDLATYVVHRLHHTVPALWEIHKVHHSAEVLSPLTVLRKHPVFDLLSRGMKALLIGPLQGLVFFLFAGPVDAVSALGVNAVFAVFHLFGAGLRHSHVWLSYGRVLNHVLISPAQHQIHHSRARRHWDRNFGQIFAVWDWLFGTLYVPAGRERLEFGIDGDRAEHYDGLVRGCLRPMRAAAHVVLARCGAAASAVGAARRGR